MAKVNAPLLSFGASGKLAGSLVFFNWKGLNIVRRLVVPANPQTTGQNTQRGYLTDVVAAIHAAEALAVDPIAEDDKVAYSAWASIFASPRTWFNQICKSWLDQRVAALKSAIYRAGSTTPASGQLTVSVDFSEDGANSITAGNFHYGTSKSNLVNTIAATVAADNATVAITGLTNGTKYFWQFRPTTHADFVGAYSGIYYGTPAA